MNDGRLLERFGVRTDLHNPQQIDDTEPTLDLESFGWLRGSRDRAAMLELRKRDGYILAVSYGWIDRVEFDPSQGITLHHASQKIGVRGRNLNREIRPNVRLFEGIVRHRVPWLQEACRSKVVSLKYDETVIEEITLG